MNCPNCGSLLSSDAKFCSNCGYRNDQNVQCNDIPNGSYADSGNKIQTAEDGKNVGYNVLSFFVPVVGLILWLLWKDEYPIRAKSCGKSALISVILAVVFYVLLIVAMIGFTALSAALMTDASYDVASGLTASSAAVLPALFM